MRVQLGQLYDLKYTVAIERFCFGEVIRPLETLNAHHFKTAIAYILGRYSVSDQS